MSLVNVSKVGTNDSTLQFFAVSMTNTYPTCVFQDQKQRIMEEICCDSDSSDDFDLEQYPTYNKMVRKSADSKRIMSSNLPLLFASGKPHSLDTISQVSYQFQFISNFYL